MTQAHRVGVRNVYVDPGHDYVPDIERARFGYVGDTHIGPQGRVQDVDIAWNVAHAEAPHRELAMAAQGMVRRDQLARELGTGVLTIIGGGPQDGLRFGPFLTDRERSQAALIATVHYMDGHEAAAAAWEQAEGL